MKPVFLEYFCTALCSSQTPTVQTSALCGHPGLQSCIMICLEAAVILNADFSNIFKRDPQY